MHLVAKHWGVLNYKQYRDFINTTVPLWSVILTFNLSFSVLPARLLHPVDNNQVHCILKLLKSPQTAFLINGGGSVNTSQQQVSHEVWLFRYTLNWTEELDQSVFNCSPYQPRDTDTIPTAFHNEKAGSYSVKVAGWYRVILLWQIIFEFAVLTQHVADRV